MITNILELRNEEVEAARDGIDVHQRLGDAKPEVASILGTVDSLLKNEEGYECQLRPKACCLSLFPTRSY